MDDVSSGWQQDPNRAIPYRQPSHLRTSQRSTGTSGEIRYFLRTASGALLSLREEERFLWQLLDGTKSFAELDTAFYKRFGIRIAREEFARFLDELLAAQALEEVAEGAGMPLRQGVQRPVAVADGSEQVEDSVPRQRPSVFARYASSLGWRAKYIEPFSIVIGNPDRFFAFLAKIFWPVRYLTWLLVPATFIAFLIPMKHTAWYFTDYSYISKNWPFWPLVWFIEHNGNLLSRLVEGAVIRGYGGSVQQFRFRLFMGIMLRAFIDETSLEAMPLRNRLWAHGSTLLARLAIFCTGMILWISLRQLHPTASKIALFYGIIGFFGFLICTCPFMPQEGYHWLKTYLAQPNLNTRAFGVVRSWFGGPRVSEKTSIAERWGLVFFAVGTAIVSGGYVAHNWFEIDQAALGTMQGLGFLLTIAVFVMSGLYFYALRRFGRKMRALQRLAAGKRRRGAGPTPSPQETI